MEVAVLSGALYKQRIVGGIPKPHVMPFMPPYYCVGFAFPLDGNVKKSCRQPWPPNLH